MLLQTLFPLSKLSQLFAADFTTVPIVIKYSWNTNVQRSVSLSTKEDILWTFKVTLLIQSNIDRVKYRVTGLGQVIVIRRKREKLLQVRVDSIVLQFMPLLSDSISC